MSSKGTITADIIKNAMFKAADDIEGRYAKMPKTIGDYWTLMKNKAIQAFTPVIEKISELINTPEFQEFFENLCVGIQLAAEAINWLIDGVQWLYGVIEPFIPILGALAGAFLILTVYTKLATAAKWLFGDVLSMLATKAGLVNFAIIALILILTYLWFTNDEVAYWILYAWDALVIGAMTLWLGLKTVFYGLILIGQFFLLGMVGVAYGVLWAWYMFQNGLEAVGVGILYIFQRFIQWCALDSKSELLIY